MTTQNAASTQPQDNKTPDRKFEAGKYGLSLLVLLIAYMFTIGLGILLISLLSLSIHQLLDLVFFATFFFALTAGIITWFYKPAYVPHCPVKPITVSLMAVGAGVFMFFAMQLLRQPDDASRLRIIQTAMFITVMSAGLIFGMTSMQASRPIKSNLDLPAFIIAVVGTFASALGGPSLLRIEDPEIQLRVSVLLAMLGLVLLIALFVLSKINTPDFKRTPIPDGYAGIIHARDRIERISFQPSVDMKLHGEKFEKHDLRIRTTPMTLNDCISADHMLVDIQASIEWHPCNTEDGLRTFITQSIDPMESIRALFKSMIVHEVALRSSPFIAGREDQIAGAVKAQMSSTAMQYGVVITRIAITHTRIRHPSPAQGMSPLAEVSMLQMMDSAVRNASKSTIKHAETMTKAEASAAASKAGKEKSEDEDKPHSY